MVFDFIPSFKCKSNSFWLVIIICRFKIFIGNHDITNTIEFITFSHIGVFPRHFYILFRCRIAIGFGPSSYIVMYCASWVVYNWKFKIALESLEFVVPQFLWYSWIFLTNKFTSLTKTNYQRFIFPTITEHRRIHE